MRFRRKSSEISFLDELPDILIKTLMSLEVESLVLIPGERILFQSSGINVFGILKDERIINEDLMALIRVVRRTHETHRGSLEVARGPIGSGKRELKVSVTPLNDEGMDRR